MNSSSNNTLEQFVTEKYITKQNFIHRSSFATSSLSKIWEAILQRRKEKSIKLELWDKEGNKLWFVPLPIFDKIINSIEEAASQDIQDIIKHITNWDDKISELLIDEAFNSSVIEGAISTRKRTSEMIKKQQAPQNHSEKMIYNNYEAMNFIFDKLDEPLSEDVFVQLHKIITNDTLDQEDVSIKYRDDSVRVEDPSKNEVIYVAPEAKVVQKMMDDLFTFINTETPEIHPIVKACIIHFYIVYVHPFFDGNGRTSRAFTVLYLLKNNLNFFKYLSISTAIRGQKSKYYKAILDCEQNPTDVTYFITNQLYLMQHRLSQLFKELQIEISKKILSEWLKQSEIKLSTRQIKQIQRFAKQEKNVITIKDYQKKHKVSYETARSDLHELYALGIFDKVKNSRMFVYKFNFHEFITKISKELSDYEVEI